MKKYDASRVNIGMSFGVIGPYRPTNRPINRHQCNSKPLDVATNWLSRSVSQSVNARFLRLSAVVLCEICLQICAKKTTKKICKRRLSEKRLKDIARLPTPTQEMALLRAKSR